MRTRKISLAAIAAATLVLAACSNADTTSGSDATAPPTTGGSDVTAAGQCLPVPGDQLVVLEDDLQLQNSDNIIPVVSKSVATPDVMAALDAVSGLLDTETLIELNKAVDIDRRTSEEVAEEWVAQAGLSLPESGDDQDIVIGAANFSENITLAEIYAQVLDDIGYDADVREIGNRETYLPALMNGEIHIVPEYAATFAEFLDGDEENVVASGEIDETVAALGPLAEAEGLVIGQAADAQNQNAYAVTQGFVDQYGVTTLSDLAQNCDGIVLGGPPECPERPFCQPGLENEYGIVVSEFRSLDAGGPLTKTAITTGEVAVGMVFSSDGALATG